MKKKLIKKHQRGDNIWAPQQNLLTGIEDITNFFNKNVTSSVPQQRSTVSLMQPKSTNPVVSSMFPKQLSDTAKMFQPGGGNLSGKGTGFLDSLKGMGTEIAGSAPELIDAGLGALGVKRADANLARGAAGFDKGASTAFKVAMKTGNPWAIAATGIVAGLSKINMYGGKTLKSSGTDAINMKGYTPGMETAGKFAITGSGKKYDRYAKQNKNIANTNLLKGNASYGDSQNQLAASNSYGDIATKNYQQLQGGINPNVLSAKKGGTINPAKLSNIKKKALRNVKKAQEGSMAINTTTLALGGKVNIIPEGALHAHKNHYEGDLAEQVTSKGIPVITYEEGDKIVQHAEIERNEVIFHIDTTKQLEEWFKEYNDTEDTKKKAELEIECGKFLVEEILENTLDKTGLLEEVN